MKLFQTYLLLVYQNTYILPSSKWFLHTCTCITSLLQTFFSKERISLNQLKDDTNNVPRLSAFPNLCNAPIMPKRTFLMYCHSFIISEDASGEVVLLKGETVLVVGASQRRGHLVVEHKNVSLHVTFQFLELKPVGVNI